MKITQKFRWLMAAGVAFISIMLLLFLSSALKSLLGFWELLQNLPVWLFYPFVALVLALLGGSVYLVYRLVSSKAPQDEDKPKIRTAEELEQEIERFEATGMDASSFREELDRLQARKSSGQIHISLFGDVSTGKSSIIKALLPEQDIKISLRGGSTREIKDYIWKTRSGDELILTDLPGRNEAEGVLDEIARDEAIRSQIVVYVVDSDLSRTQLADIEELHAFEKPLLITLNKSDLYSSNEQLQLCERIQSRFPAKEKASYTPKVVFIQSGGMEEVLLTHPDGREEEVLRPRKVDVSALALQLQQEIDQHMEWLEQLRDASVFSLIQQKMDESKLTQRRDKAEKIIRNSTRNAIIGSMAAISPGTDIVIQGAIGVYMVKQLCDLYESPMSQIDIDRFLDFSQGQVKKSIPLILAVAGNGLKAFPGIGTVAGGLVHAVAYGLIFDALGHSVAHTLEQRGSLQTAPAALTFREMLSGNLEERAKTFAKVVISQSRQKK